MHAKIKFYYEVFIMILVLCACCMPFTKPFHWLRTNLHGFHILGDIHQTASIESRSDWVFANSFLLSNSIYRNRTISTSFDGVFLSHRYHISREFLFSIQRCNFCPSSLSLNYTLSQSTALLFSARFSVPV